jgi:hypothetical protein
MPDSPTKPWFRVYTELLHDRKVRGLPASQRWVWIAVLSLGRQSCEPGRLLISTTEPITDREIADEASVSLADVKTALVTFVQRDMLRSADGVYEIVKWNRRQFDSDSSTDRSRKHREVRVAETDDATLRETLHGHSQQQNGNGNATHHSQSQSTEIKDILLKPLTAKQAMAQFWPEYPRKVGKAACEDFFDRRRVTQALLDRMIAQVRACCRTEQWQNSQFVPHPKTWLNQRRWEDDEPESGRAQGDEPPPQAASSPRLAYREVTREEAMAIELEDERRRKARREQQEQERAAI